MMKFVLVHGSWHDGPTWNAVIRELNALGHEAHAPTIAGHGDGVPKDVDHARCTQSVVDYIRERELRDFVLVGHSYGGTIIAKVAEAVSERIRRLVFWNAFVPQHGNALLDEVPPHYRALFSQLAAESSDNTVTMPWPVWRDAFMNDADEDTARAAYRQLSSEPFQPFADKLDLEKFYALQVPKSYLNCQEDTALPQGEWGWHPRMSNRLGLFRLVQMHGGHEVMFTDPEGLARKLVEAGRD
ncbi:alpha/beta fold hydrolase [Burkholderia pseudomultivorans]|uniref:Salicylate esterase n=1 Tax=Burkholderia pseudomultivorans TaxID=1207504 RepID=A0A132EBG5_9BURK|nr:alpha/beta hydrolase [Burkholderia pseudomultivorans]KWF22115.1 salicylate esterase [Burkholderia pseudomultivorans]